MRFAPALLVCAVVFAGCEVNLNTEGVSARETRTFKVTGAPELALDTFDGAIELHSWDRNEVEVEVERRAMEQDLLDQIKIDTQQQGDKVVVKITGPSPRGRHGVTFGVSFSPTARLRVVVPKNANVSAMSGDGSIRAEAIEGRIVLNTSDGSVTGTRLGGNIQVRSGDGSIHIEQASGTLDLETNDGTIGIDATPAVLRARTGDGSIRASIGADSVMAGNWELTTSDGNVLLTLPSVFNAELDAETSDGAVRANHPLVAAADDRGEDENGERRRERRRALHTKLGDGGKLLKIRTADGTIRIER